MGRIVGRKGTRPNAALWARHSSPTDITMRPGLSGPYSCARGNESKCTAGFVHVNRDLAGSLHASRLCSVDACFSCDLPISAIGLMCPTRFESPKHDCEINTVSRRIARRSLPDSRLGRGRDGKTVTRPPRFSSARHGSNTALCSSRIL